MLSVRRGRVARRLAVLMTATRGKVRRRERLRENAAALASIRAALAEAGVDPAQNSAVRYFAGAEREMLSIGDTETLQRVDAAFLAQDPEFASRESLAARAAAAAPRFAGGLPSDSGNSPFDWYAWSLAAPRQAALAC